MEIAFLVFGLTFFTAIIFIVTKDEQRHYERRRSEVRENGRELPRRPPK